MGACMPYSKMSQPPWPAYPAALPHPLSILAHLTAPSAWPCTTCPPPQRLALHLLPPPPSAWPCTTCHPTQRLALHHLPPHSAPGPAPPAPDRGHCQLLPPPGPPWLRSTCALDLICGSCSGLQDRGWARLLGLGRGSGLWDHPGPHPLGLRTVVVGQGGWGSCLGWVGEAAYGIIPGLILWGYGLWR